MRNNNGLFTLLSLLIVLMFMGTAFYIGFMTYKCYASNDPNSIACFMISNRHEIGIRNR